MFNSGHPLLECEHSYALLNQVQVHIKELYEILLGDNVAYAEGRARSKRNL
jgi:hypothetical protein